MGCLGAFFAFVRSRFDCCHGDGVRISQVTVATGSDKPESCPTGPLSRDGDKAQGKVFKIRGEPLWLLAP
jgi:hypothetical protein